MSQYEDEYRKWVASLSPKQRAKLVAQGLDKPLDDNSRIYKSDPTVAFENASAEFDYDILDGGETAQNDADDVAKSYGCQLLRWTLERLQGAKNDKTRRLEIDTLMLTLGMSQMVGVKTQTELSRKYGMTRAAISARVKSWQNFLGLRPTFTMKSPTACKNYKASRLKNLTSS